MWAFINTHSFADKHFGFFSHRQFFCSWSILKINHRFRGHACCWHILVSDFVQNTSTQSLLLWSKYRNYLSIRVFHCYTGYWFSVAFRHVCRLTASSGVRFLCFVTVFASFVRFISGLCRQTIATGRAFPPGEVKGEKLGEEATHRLSMLLRFAMDRQPIR